MSSSFLSGHAKDMRRKFPRPPPLPSIPLRLHNTSFLVWEHVFCLESAFSWNSSLTRVPAPVKLVYLCGLCRLIIIFFLGGGAGVSGYASYTLSSRCRVFLAFRITVGFWSALIALLFLSFFFVSTFVLIGFCIYFRLKYRWFRLRLLREKK